MMGTGKVAARCAAGLVAWLALGLSLGACSSSTTASNEDGGGDASCTAASCDDGRFCNGVETCGAGGCAAGTAPCASACSEATRSCAEPCPDGDGDGFTRLDCGGTDCDDTRGAVHPGAAELCDVGNVDEDCDPATFGVRDADSDTYADAACCNVDAAGAQHCGNDCDDTSAGVHPTLAEVCDGRDNDCDDALDEGVIPTWYTDVDGDHFGSTSAATMQQCLDPGLGWAPTGGDCDDSLDDVHPGLPEACNGRDDNCRDGIADETACACTTGTIEACGSDVGACATGTRTCIAGAWGSCGGTYVGSSPEACDPTHPGPAGTDEDCDGATDESVAVNGCWTDVDADTYGEGAASWACAGTGGVCPMGTATRGGDCGAPSAATHPGASETCDSADNDCDSRIDEGLHVRRVDVNSTDIPCAVYEYGRDLTCEQRMSTACGTLTRENYCGIGAGFYVSAGSYITIGCAAPAYYRSDIMRWELTARHAGCDGSAGEYDACQAAAHRYCGVFGYVTGYTTRVGTDTYTLTCFDATQVQMLGPSWAELDARDGAAASYCAGAPRDGWWCARAVDQYCREHGFVTGFGPIEYAGSGTLVACLRSY